MKLVYNKLSFTIKQIESEQLNGKMQLQRFVCTEFLQNVFITNCTMYNTFTNGLF